MRLSRICRRTLVGTGVVSLLLGSVTPARSQWIVNDPANTAQHILIVIETILIYNETRRLRDIWEQFRQQVPAAQRAGWAIEPTRWRVHGDLEDPWGTYNPLAHALDLGDPDHAAYLGSVIPLPRYPAAIAARLTPIQRQHAARTYATLLLADGAGRVAVQTSADARWHARRALDALEQVQRDLLHPDATYHGNIAMLQKIAGTRVLSARTTGVGNQLLASLVEMTLADQKGRRDTEVRALNRDLTRRLQVPQVAQQTMRGSDDARLDMWRRR